MKTVYVCSDTVTGIFSGIYDAWKTGRGEADCAIALRGMLEQQLFCDYVEVEETEHKAIAVENLIKKHLGRQAYWDIYHAVLAADKDKGDGDPWHHAGGKDASRQHQDHGALKPS